MEAVMTQTPIRWRQVALSYPCDICTAGPGEQCLTWTGNKAWTPHAARTRKASDNGWRDPDGQPRA